MSRRIRRTPYTDCVEAHGVRGYSVVNHMLLPKAFEASVEDDYWHLREHVQLWDVSTQRQVDIAGPDAARLIQWMTPRDLSRAAVGRCYYIPLIDEAGGLINDPVLLKLADDHFWLSIADSDVLLWAKGLALGAGLDVAIHEPDVSPLAIQGPKATDVMVDVFGSRIQSLTFFEFEWFDFQGTQQLIARSGYSRQGGFEIYLRGSALGTDLWKTIWDAGSRHNIRPGCPNLIERIEGGLMSYGNEFTLENNPLECGLGEYCQLDGNVDCIGMPALQAIAKSGIANRMRGVAFGGDPCPPCAQPWQVQTVSGQPIGQITSGIWSPRLRHNVGLALLDARHSDIEQRVQVRAGADDHRAGVITTLPFPDAVRTIS